MNNSGLKCIQNNDRWISDQNRIPNKLACDRELLSIALTAANILNKLTAVGPKPPLTFKILIIFHVKPLLISKFSYSLRSYLKMPFVTVFSC